MAELRDYAQWHRYYDDPRSAVSWRLATVQGWLAEALEERAGPVRVLSVCAGDGRDILGVLADRGDAGRVEVVLLELHPELAQRARDAAARDVPAAHVSVRTVDAGAAAAYPGAAPADIVLLVGILGNISDADIDRLIDTAPALCRPGATLLWSRSRHRGDRNPHIRARFAAAGFTEVHYAEHEDPAELGVGAQRYAGPAVPLPAPDTRLFEFIR